MGLDRLTARAPLDPMTAIVALEVLNRTGRTDEALARVDGVLERSPYSARAQYTAGHVFYRGQQYVRSAECFAQADALYSSAASRRWQGRALANAGRLDEAEAILEELRAVGPKVLLDLSWVAVRRGQPTRALKLVDECLARDPRNEYALAARQRLLASSMSTTDVLADVQSLLDFGEFVPETMWQPWLSALLRKGQIQEAHDMVASLANPRPAALIQLGWAARRLEAHDIATDCFLRGFGHSVRKPNFLKALEHSAKHTGRVERTIEVYERFAPTHNNLYGRIKKLRRDLPQ